MPADAAGNNVGAVGIPITGNAGVAPVDVANVLSASAGGAKSLVLPAAFRKLGLFKTDGGFEWTTEKDGDDIEFFQSGYSIPSGLAKAELVLTLAQTDAVVREVSYGKVPDANGYITIDAGGHATRYLVFTEEIFKNGWVERRQGVASVASVKIDKSTRGEIRSTQLTFKFDRSDFFGGNHFGQWLVDTNGTPPTGATSGTPGTFTPGGSTVPANLFALQALGNLGQSSAWTTGKYVNLGDASKAYWNGTAWVAGTAA